MCQVVSSQTACSCNAPKLGGGGENSSVSTRGLALVLRESQSRSPSLAQALDPKGT